MDALLDTLHVEIEYSTEDEKYGPVYIAAFQEIRAATDARTVDELLKNIREVVDLYLETQDDITDVRLAPNVRIMLTMELPTYAATA